MQSWRLVARWRLKEMIEKRLKNMQDLDQITQQV